MKDLSDIFVVLPSLDPDEKLGLVIDGLLEQGFRHIILINDGSKEENLHYFHEAARHSEVTLLHHPVNRGKGAALKTAFAWFLANRPDARGVVTVDGDNQHHPEDTRACCEKMLETGRVILGCRDFSLPHVPARSRFGNRTTSAVFQIFCGLNISDTQTGLRAIPTQALKTLTAIKGERFEYETNMLLALKEHAIAFSEVKIRTVYIEENKSSHFRAVRDSWRIYKLILAHFFRYTVSALVSALVDEGVYLLLSALLHSTHLYGLALTAVCTAGARIVSSLLNFFMNKQLVFRSSAATGKAMLRYYTLALPQMAAQILLTQGAYLLLGIEDHQVGLRALLYAVVMTLLYIASYMIQQRWVFAPEKNRNT